MHDYMKALYHRFQAPSERAEELERETDKTHKQLAKQLGKQQRRLLLRLVDLEAALCETSPVWTASCPAAGWLMASIRNCWLSSHPTTSRMRTNGWPAKD